MAKEFARLARAARLAARVPLREVAEALGVSVAYVSEVERGNRPAPSPARAAMWANAVKGDTLEFQEAALTDRSVIQLDVEAAPEFKRRVALALGRSFEGLSEEQAREILRIVGG